MYFVNQNCSLCQNIIWNRFKNSVSHSLQSSSLIGFSSVLCLYIKLRSGRAGQLCGEGVTSFMVYTLFIDLMMVLQLVFY